MRFFWLVCLTVAAWAQQPNKEKLAEKPSPREKAVQLLDHAAEVVAARPLEIQVVGLLHIGENYQAIDKKKALEFLQQSFTAASTLPLGEDGHRTELQSAVVQVTSEISVPAAVEMLKQVINPAPMASSRIVDALLSKNDIDGAIELVNAISGNGGYPYRGVRQILKKLPGDDPRRIPLFGNAMAAYGLQPGDDFNRLLVDNWKLIPKNMAESALDSVVAKILKQDDKDFTTVTNYSTAKGSVDFNSPQDAALFDLMALMVDLNPKRAEELLSGRPQLQNAVKQFPEGTRSMTDGDSDRINTNVMRNSRSDPQPPSGAPGAQMRSLIQAREQAALDAAKENLEKGLSLVQMIPSDSKKAEALAQIAQAVSEKDPAGARNVLNKCLSLLSEKVQNPLERMERFRTWLAIAEAARRIHDDKLAAEAIEKALADAAEIYKDDANADTPNVALRDYWPSAMCYRQTIREAVKVYGVDAEPFLEKVQDPDLNLLARVEMAQALLDRPHENWQIMMSRKKR